MYKKYNDLAIKNKVSIVHSSGYDSAPADLGNLFAKMEFEKEGSVCTQSEMFVSFGSGPSGVAINATTFHAALLSFANVESLRELRKTTHRTITYPTDVKMKLNKGVKWVNHVSAYTGMTMLNYLIFSSCCGS